jgi:hypothetical protein
MWRSLMDDAAVRLSLALTCHVMHRADHGNRGRCKRAGWGDFVTEPERIPLVHQGHSSAFWRYV